MIIAIYSPYVTGWIVAATETAEVDEIAQVRAGQWCAANIVVAAPACGSRRSSACVRITGAAWRKRGRHRLRAEQGSLAG